MLELTMKEQSGSTFNVSDKMLLDFYDLLISYEEYDDLKEGQSAYQRVLDEWENNYPKYKVTYGKDVTPRDVYNRIKAASLAISIFRERFMQTPNTPNEIVMLGESIYQMIQNKEEIISSFSRNSTIH